MENYNRLSDIVEGIKSLPSNQRHTAYKTVIDMLWQNVPIERERDVFGSFEVSDLEVRVTKNT